MHIYIYCEFLYVLLIIYADNNNYIYTIYSISTLSTHTHTVIYSYVCLRVCRCSVIA